MPTGHTPLDLAKHLDRIHLHRVQRGARRISTGENQARPIDGANDGSAKIADAP